MKDAVDEHMYVIDMPALRIPVKSGRFLDSIFHAWLFERKGHTYVSGDERKEKKLRANMLGLIEEYVPLDVIG